MKARLVLILAALSLSGIALAGSRQSASEPKVLRTGGDYVVANIEQRADGSFVVEFKSQAPTGRFDVLKLSSDHVHVSVKTGQKIRLSAEVSAEHGATADVSQVVVFLPNPTGAVPVWLLSNTAPPRDLRAVRYLEMHVPQTDFMVL
jgi:hypothetical protein